MPTGKRPRYGSLQFYPRKRAAKFLPSVNWDPVSNNKSGMLGFITYKVGMASATVSDKTEKSLTEKKRITIPVTILEAPNMKIFSVRFYKHSKPLKDVIVSNDKELKKKVKVPKSLKEFDKEVPEDYDAVHIIAYSLAKQTGVKKTPDLIELAIAGDKPLDFVKPLIGKEIPLADFLNDFNLFDVRGLTTGKGMQGPVKRFGITFKSHKSEKGRRNPGSIAPWHPAHVTFRAPMAGQLGLFTRIHYNQKLITSGTIQEKDINPIIGFKRYGKIKTSYIIIKGSVQGPPKRQILITPAFRPTKAKAKLNYELIKLITK